MSDWQPLQVGEKYKVKLDDCCIEGEFTATLTFYHDQFGEDEDIEFPLMKFDNGIEFTTWNKLEFEISQDKAS